MRGSREGEHARKRPPPPSCSARIPGNPPMADLLQNRSFCATHSMTPNRAEKPLHCGRQGGSIQNPVNFRMRRQPLVAILALMQLDQAVINGWSGAAPFWEKHREIIRQMFAPVTQA